MASYSPLLKRVFTTCDRVHIGFSWPFVISKEEYSKEEIEKLRREHKRTLKEDGLYFIANFLPDDIRPKGIPKL
ncbi:MAG: hypothetical protein IJM54_02580 [Thermoguttaceae bacterium]|nr:hypothetical protein [Thermoguttaceae bacterium]